MIKWIHLKTDFKQLLREPIMALLLLLPLFIPIIFKLMLLFLIPFIQQYIPFDLEPYRAFILSFVLLLSPSLLGMVMGFMLIDDRDNNIIKLMQVTPLGRFGYLFQRLFFVLLGVLIYVPYSYMILGFYDLGILTFVYLTLLLSLYGSTLGLLLYRLATDKVNGLTYAKMLNIVMLFAFAPLLNVKWITILAGFFPTYWITKIIIEPNNILAYFMGLIVHVIWLGLCLLDMNRTRD